MSYPAPYPENAVAVAAGLIRRYGGVRAACRALAAAGRAGAPSPAALCRWSSGRSTPEPHKLAGLLNPARVGAITEWLMRTPAPEMVRWCEDHFRSPG